MLPNRQNFCCDNLWKTIIMALENWRNFFSYVVATLLDVCVFVGVLVMRVQGSLRVVLNTMIWPNMLVERSSKRSVRISAVDADDGIKIYLIQVGQSLDVL